MKIDILVRFVNEHSGDDPAALLLQRAKYPEVDMEQAVRQIEGKRQAATKWPSLAFADSFLFPPRLNREQSSSDATADYKQRLAVRILGSIANPVIADLTGGMGIDTLWLAKTPGSTVHYVEQSAELCQYMEHNRVALGTANIEVHCADSMVWLAGSVGISTLTDAAPVDLAVIDPARRDDRGRKVAAFEDCQPNILEHFDMLNVRCRNLLIKASPMIDITLACQQLGDINEVHILTVKGECKEVLFVKESSASPQMHDSRGTLVVCSELADDSPDFQFFIDEEKNASLLLCKSVGKYLYVPSAGIMKAAAFKLVSQRFGIHKLASNTHLYTSDTIRNDFPGRILSVLQEIKLDKKTIAKTLPEKQAHVLTRNFPVAAADLQKQLGLKEGGEHFIVATTIGKRKIGLLCKQY